MSPPGILLFAIDLGTSATTARFVRVHDRIDSSGNIQRQNIGHRAPIEMKDWPGGLKGDAIGKACLPTDLVYARATGELLFWGFEAQEYFNQPAPEISFEEVFTVQHIKLLLPDPDQARVRTPASERHKRRREELVRVLGKQPIAVFEDFMNAVVSEVVNSAKRCYGDFSSNQVELALAFPSGWPESVHREVAAIGARAMTKALAGNKIVNIKFGIHNVYTLSETLCGVKEWLEANIDDAAASMDLDMLPTNINELNEGDFFLPVDIGGGTGCLTPLQLISKKPLQVDQIRPTQSLEVSGEAVEAEFERFLRSTFLPQDYDGSVERFERQINRICRSFREEKKDCSPKTGNSTWNVEVSRIRPNAAKGFGDDVIKIDRRLLETCFDPAIAILEAAILDVLAKMPAIKTIVFLGQFGGSSAYLRSRMARSTIANKVKLRHSQTGKMDVVKGALSERQKLRDKFVRKTETTKSYGTLVTLPWGPGLEGTELFPNARRDGAVPFENEADGLRVKVIEWAIPKGTIIEGERCDVGRDGRRHHTWKFSEEDIEFEDLVIESDEIPPTRGEGKSHTLWTHAHEENQLFIDGVKVDVQQLPFSWDLSMSQKLSPTGQLLGPFSINDLETLYEPPKKKKNKRRIRYRKLDYELVWDITEMQVKTNIRAIFPGMIGPGTVQLAKQRMLGEEEKKMGESRSVGLERDIKISEGPEGNVADVRRAGNGVSSSLFVGGSNSEEENDEEAEDSAHVIEASEHFEDDDELADQQLNGSEIWGREGEQLVEDLVRQHLQQQIDRQGTRSRSSSRQGLRSGVSISSPASLTEEESLRQAYQRSTRLPVSGPSNERVPRDGCYTCNLRKQQCTTNYTFDSPSNGYKCSACLQSNMTCHRTAPTSINDFLPNTTAKPQENVRKRKSKDSSAAGRDPSRRKRKLSNAVMRSVERERSATIFAESEGPFTDAGWRESITRPKRVPGRGRALRGGLGGGPG